MTPLLDVRFFTFTVNSNSMTLLHGFIKKQQATLLPDLALARGRLRQLKRK